MVPQLWPPFQEREQDSAMGSTVFALAVVFVGAVPESSPSWGSAWEMAASCAGLALPLAEKL